MDIIYRGDISVYIQLTHNIVGCHSIFNVERERESSVYNECVNHKQINMDVNVGPSRKGKYDTFG